MHNYRHYRYLSRTERITKQSFALQASNLQGDSMYAPQEPPVVCFSVLAFSVIIVAAKSCLLPPCVVPALGLCLHIPEHKRNAPCTNRRNCAGGVFRYQTARPEYKGAALVSVYKVKDKGKQSFGWQQTCGKCRKINRFQRFG